MGIPQLKITGTSIDNFTTRKIPQKPFAYEECNKFINLIATAGGLKGKIFPTVSLRLLRFSTSFIIKINTNALNILRSTAAKRLRKKNLKEELQAQT